MTNKKISAIVPYHNASISIIQTLEALQKSSFPLFEIICVNDASTDNTINEIEAFTTGSSLNIVSLHPTSVKRGAAAARNFGAQKAMGDYLLFVDADVIVEKYTIERMLYRLLEQPCVAVVAQFQDYSYQPGILAHFQAYMVNAMYNNLDIHNSPCLGTQCVLMETSLFRNTSGFNETYIGATVEDFEFGYRLQTQGYKICIAPGAEIIHNHQYNTKSFIRNYFTKSRDLATLLLHKPNIRIANSGYHDITNFLVLFVIGLEVLILLMGVMASRRLLWLGGILPIMILLSWRGFIYQVVHRWGWVVAFYFVIIRTVVVLVGWIGVINSLTKVLFTKPTSWLSVVHFRLAELLTKR